MSWASLTWDTNCSRSVRFTGGISFGANAGMTNTPHKNAMIAMVHVWTFSLLPNPGGCVDNAPPTSITHHHSVWQMAFLFSAAAVLRNEDVHR